MFDHIHTTITQKWEGGISDHPADTGGLTAYGASIKFVQGIAETQAGRDWLQRIGVVLPVTRSSMKLLTPEHAKAMFKHEFWQPLRLDDLPMRMAALIYDAAVNAGSRQSVKLAQRGYNSCVIHGQPLSVDGQLGPLSRKALRRNDTDVVVRAIVEERRKFYRGLVRIRPANEAFLDGWLARCDDVEAKVLSMERRSWSPI